MSLVECKNLKKTFRTKPSKSERKGKIIRAVDGVNLTVLPGEHLGLVGESGSGKTTLGRLIVKLYKPDGGQILVRGKDVLRGPKKERKRLQQDIQMIFQDPYSSLDPRFTVRGILLEAIKQSPKNLSVQFMQQQMLAVLQQVKLPVDSFERYPHEFSGGERQRIAIARALLMNPRLLICDEAVSSLDVLIQEQIIRLLKDLEQKYNMTYVFITHNLRVVRKLCQKIAVMYKGRIVEWAPTEAIFEAPRHPYTKQLLAAAMDYEAPEREDFELPENSRLVDIGNDHFVID